MPKRKRRTEKTGAHLAQEPSARPSLRKRESHQSLPVQRGKKQRRENGWCRALSSPSTTESAREDRCSTQLPDNNTEKSTNDTSFENHFRKTHIAPFELDADHKRKHEKELDQAGIESPKRPQERAPTAVSSNLDSTERLELPEDGLSKKQKVQSKEDILKTSVPVIESPKKPEKELEAQKIEQKERQDPISYWTAHHIWPENFAEQNPMAFSNIPNKRLRTSDDKDERSYSYSQSRKNGEVPEQYTAAYERYILIRGLDMDLLKGEEFISNESKDLCISLQLITHKTIKPIIFPTTAIRKVINFCRDRNEAIVNRDITPMIIPPIASLYFEGDNNLEHVIDEVNANWYNQCVLEGPQLRPDLAIGLFSSAFTEEENEKLKRYNSVDNWTSVTVHMFFPFLMCEVKCGREGLDKADRQNMHSCSVAVRALLRIEQEADKYRSEKKMDSLNRQVLVFSISHDQQDARLYGHYAIVQGKKWTYYRYPIQKFDLIKKDSLLAIHNYVRNILKSHLPEHVKRLKDALAALPDPSGLPDSSGLSLTTLDSQIRDADGFAVPARPDRSQNAEAKKKWHESRLVEQIDKLMLQIEEEREENRKREERQRQEHKEEVERQHKEEIERQRKEVEQIDKLMLQLEEEREENRKREERQRQEHKEEVERQRQEHKEQIERQRKESKEIERQRKESEERMNKLLERLLEKAAI